MVAVVDNLAKGEGKNKGVGDVLQSGDAGSNSSRVGDVGDDPPHGKGHWVVSTQGSYMDNWEVSPVLYGQNLVVPTALKIIPNTLGFTPSLLKIIDNCTHLFLTLCRFFTNSGQASSNDVII